MLFLHRRSGAQASWASQRCPSQPKVQSACSRTKGFSGMEVRFEKPMGRILHSLLEEPVSIELSFWAVSSSSEGGRMVKGAGR